MRVLTFVEWRQQNSGTAVDYNAYLRQAVNRSEERQFTREEIGKLVNAGTQIVLDDDGVDLGNRDYDLVNIVINAALSMFDEEPPTTLDGVIERNYEPDSNECSVCGGELEFLSEELGYAHVNNEDDTDGHTPVLETAAAMVRGWLNQY